MAGYDGISMSNNARDAYDKGLKPKSKWRKCDILKRLAKNGNVSDEHMNLFKKMNLDQLKRDILVFAERHHTGSYYNPTDFYDCQYNPDKDYKLEPRTKKQKPKKPIPTEWKLAKATYRKSYFNAKYNKYIDANGIVEGRNFWTIENDRLIRKKIDGTHFQLNEILGKVATPSEEKSQNVPIEFQKAYDKLWEKKSSK